MRARGFLIVKPEQQGDLWVFSPYVEVKVEQNYDETSISWMGSIPAQRIVEPRETIITATMRAAQGYQGEPPPDFLQLMREAMRGQAIKLPAQPQVLRRFAKDGEV